MKKKVFVALSGGVDSSVSAYLLTKKGFDVTGVFFKNTDANSKAGEYFKHEEEGAKKVAEYLNIPFVTIKLEKEFKNLVINPFTEKYEKGLTPNPCINCNRDFKFGIFAEECFKRGADLIATGHYAKTKRGRLYKAKDSSKDQTYFLHQLSSDILKRTLFPLGNLAKREVRDIAKELNLPSKEKKDSQKICFLKGETIQEYLKISLKTKEGNIIDVDTKEIVGKHEGIFQYTLGQRKGIEIGGLKEPYFVCGRDIEQNIIFVAKGRENEKLWKNIFQVKNFHFVNRKNAGITRGLRAVIRYHSKEIPTNVEWNLPYAKFILKEEVWLPSEGQSLVVYRSNECIGGGEISSIA